MVSPELARGRRERRLHSDHRETIDLLGYRFAVEVEAIAFGLAHPEIHRRERINAYGSSASCDDSRHVNACLYEFEGDRELGIRCSTAVRTNLPSRPSSANALPS